MKCKNKIKLFFNIRFDYFNRKQKFPSITTYKLLKSEFERNFQRCCRNFDFKNYCLIL